jgi:hypothetical protein
LIRFSLKYSILSYSLLTKKLILIPFILKDSLYPLGRELLLLLLSSYRRVSAKSKGARGQRKEEYERIKIGAWPAEEEREWGK